MLKNALQVVVIDLEKTDDPQVIFETLNARGEPLLPADLLRNFIFLRAARAQEAQESLYGEYWRKFDEPFWRQEVRQGRLLRPRSDLFMLYFFYPVGGLLISLFATSLPSTRRGLTEIIRSRPLGKNSQRSLARVTISAE